MIDSKVCNRGHLLNLAFAYYRSEGNAELLNTKSMLGKELFLESENSSSHSLTLIFWVRFLSWWKNNKKRKNKIQKKKERGGRRKREEKKINQDTLIKEERREKEENPSQNSINPFIRGASFIFFSFFFFTHTTPFLIFFKFFFFDVIFIKNLTRKKKGEREGGKPPLWFHNSRNIQKPFQKKTKKEKNKKEIIKLHISKV